MLVAGLTGNYGMGKSSVLRMFRELGAITLDADEIVNDLLNDKSVLERIREVFGGHIFLSDGQLDRAKAAAIIFSDKRSRDIFEGILHPLVFGKIDRFIDAVKDKESIVIIEIQLLFERGYLDRFDRTITVFTDEDTALKRLEGVGVSRGNALMRLDAQMPIEDKIKRADFVIDNSRTLIDTEEQVKKIYGKLMEEIKS
jgi:dephospho-CoA kinase